MRLASVSRDQRVVNFEYCSPATLPGAPAVSFPYRAGGHRQRRSVTASGRPHPFCLHYVSFSAFPPSLGPPTDATGPRRPTTRRRYYVVTRRRCRPRSHSRCRIRRFSVLFALVNRVERFDPILRTSLRESRRSCVGLHRIPEIRVAAVRRSHGSRKFANVSMPILLLVSTRLCRESLKVINPSTVRRRGEVFRPRAFVPTATASCFTVYFSGVVTENSSRIDRKPTVVS